MATAMPAIRSSQELWSTPCALHAGHAGLVAYSASRGRHGHTRTCPHTWPRFNISAFFSFFIAMILPVNFSRTMRTCMQQAQMKWAQVLLLKCQLAPRMLLHWCRLYNNILVYIATPARLAQCQHNVGVL